jgi:hypothetical protein
MGNSSSICVFFNIIIIIYLSWSWATWPVPVSRIQKSLQRSAMIPSASWGRAFYFFMCDHIPLVPVPVVARSKAARLLELWVRIPPEAWMSVCCECCVLLCRGLCVGLITRPEESYRMWCVVVCDLENLMNEGALAHWGLSRQKQNVWAW